MRLSLATVVACLSVIGPALADDAKAAIRKPTPFLPRHLGQRCKRWPKSVVSRSCTSRTR